MSRRLFARAPGCSQTVDEVGYIIGYVYLGITRVRANIRYIYAVEEQITICRYIATRARKKTRTDTALPIRGVLRCNTAAYFIMRLTTTAIDLDACLRDVFEY